MNDKMHHAIDELNMVHAQMIQKFNNEGAINAATQRAQQMEHYLRLIKIVANPEKFDVTKAQFESALEMEAIQSIISDTEQALGGRGLFILHHSWGQKISKAHGGDDIVEVQLAALLQNTGKYALNESFEGMELGVSVVGSVQGTTFNGDVNALQESTDKIIKNIMRTLPEEAVRKSIQTSDIITMPAIRSVKTDVTGYNVSIDVEASIKPEWQNIINSFKGARFSVKNYASTAATEVIHLGKTQSFKALYGVLSSLGFSSSSAQHIYIHSRISYLYGHTAAQGEGPEHIVHMRFVYELTGSGLYDSEGKKLDEVDFFVYNDPDTENIYVRSTLELIQNVCDLINMSNIGDPWTSGIVIQKSIF